MAGKTESPGARPASAGPTEAKIDLTQLNEDPQFPIYVALAVVAVTIFILLFSYLFKKGKKSRTVLLCGPCDSGKTLLFSQLLHHTKAETFTSMQENVGIMDLAEPGKKPVNVLDLPGHERIRFKCLDKHKSKAMGIVYVLDASTITKGIRDSTEFLFRILSDPLIHSSKTPVLVVCNKQDLTLAKGSTVIERELAKEIGLLRETYSGVLQATDGNVAVDHVFLGKEGKDFVFSDLKAKVDFCEVSALNDENLDKIGAWISSIA